MICTLNEDNIDKNKFTKYLNEFIVYMKSKYTNAGVKILENIGEYSHVIKFTYFNDYDLNLTIQIPAQFELKNINVILNNLKNEKYTENKLRNLQNELENFIKKELFQNEKDLIAFFEFALKRISEDFELSSKIVSSKAAATEKELKNKTKEQKLNSNKSNIIDASAQKQKVDLVDEDELEKKTPMKTSNEVVNRIIWDEKINKDFITVGYLDRFKGLQECSFSTFDWGDIVQADFGALAIPKHRINYFKYKNEIIWNKNDRLDNVFGSTGSNLNIYDVINRLENVNFQTQSSIVDSFENEDEEQYKLGRNKDKSANKLLPNYFISIPIDTAEIKENLYQLRCDLIDSNESVEDYLSPESSFHITLLTLRTNDSDELETVKNILDVLMSDEKFISDNFPINLKLEGTGEFFNKVFFVQCKSDALDKLENIKNVILDKLKSCFISTAGNYYELNPHLTIFKIKNIQNKSRDTIKDCVSSLVNKHLLKKYENFNFGQQNIKQLDLCKLNSSDPIQHSIKININTY